MRHLYYRSTPVALWHELILDAERYCRIVLNEELEHYIVSLLLRYTDKPQFVKHALGKLFLQAQHKTFAHQSDELRNIGDECLLIAGLFPERAEKRLVTVDYFIHLGKSAYSQLFETNDDQLYNRLSLNFRSITTILHTIRWANHESVLEPCQVDTTWKILKSCRH